MKLIFREGKIEIWSVGHEFYVYGITLCGDPMVCPSIGMAWAMAAKSGDGAINNRTECILDVTTPGRARLGLSRRSSFLTRDRHPFDRLRQGAQAHSVGPAFPNLYDFPTTTFELRFLSFIAGSISL
jgi:hypothetical protein